MKWKDHVKGINVAAQLNEQSTFRANPKSCHASGTDSFYCEILIQTGTTNSWTSAQYRELTGIVVSSL